MSCVVYLASRRPAPKSRTHLAHPAGVELPHDPAIETAIIPEVRDAISTGAQSADIIRLLPEAVQPGDRVLVVGAGLGIVSTLIAKQPGVETVLAVEADIALASYLDRVHAANDVPWVTTLNGVVADGARGRVPFFARADHRASSPAPDCGPWSQAMLVPTFDLNLILADEQISLVVSDLPQGAMDGLIASELEHVDRVLMGDSARSPNSAGADAAMARRGFEAEACGTAMLYRRANAAARRHTWPYRAQISAAG